ncbi:sterile alpha motif domain-containing protein 12-like [Gigantopelta aegis]|uniref:sterile alpha motif domain-containing protein 12-like n=1 Tax=Gigantopelta aegis TaxID=1735272 RepID=UPI001B889F68|nr:sterile alpha motif domain-containing protein 12-like [Gigantopelta aegis]
MMESEVKVEIGKHVEKNTLSAPPSQMEAEASKGLMMKPKDGTSGLAMRKGTKGKPKPLFFWTSADVNKWLRKHGGHCFDLYGDMLLENDVTGRTLIRMNEIKLEKLGIMNQEHRRDLLHQILLLRLKYEISDLKDLDQKGTGFELKLPETRVTLEKPVDK